MFGDDFVDQLPEDPIEAAHLICIKFKEFDESIIEQSKLEFYESYIAALGLFNAFAESYLLDYKTPIVGSDSDRNIESIRYFFYKLIDKLGNHLAQVKVQKIKNKYLLKFGRSFAYEFSDGDLRRMQELINELRDFIVGSKLFEEDHRQRILNRLEGLQRELHKRVSSLDKFWGFMGELGVALGKFGKDAKPFVDRVCEITQIVWRTQARAEELASDSPFPLLGGGKGQDQKSIDEGS
jgi:hypothetical protein